MALPNLPTSSASLSFSELKTHFGNAAYPPDNLSDYYGADNVASWYDPDATLPSMVITAAEGSDGFTSSHEAISLTFTSSEATSGFAEDDIVVSNGTLSNFTASSSTVYTATFTAGTTGATTIDVAAGTFRSTSSNAPNLVAAQFNWTTTYEPPQGTTGRLLVLHDPSSSSWKGDYQIAHLTIVDGNSTIAEYSFNDHAEGWDYKSWNGSADTATSVATAYAYDDTFTGFIETSSSSFRWNRDTGGSTPSSSTGFAFGNAYIYTETSGGSQKVFAARSPEITLDQATGNTINVTWGSYGADTGPCYYYWMADGVTSGNLNNKTLILTTDNINLNASASSQANFSV